MKRTHDMQVQEGEQSGPGINVGAIENPADHRAGLVPPGARQDRDGEGRAHIQPQRRHELIAMAAYLRAERRQFQNGSPEEDWLQAEAEIDRQLRARSSQSLERGG
jgi:Protein of unknown function (DUF2934)